MSIDPNAPLPTTVNDKFAQDIGDLRREIRELRTNGVPVSVGDGPPTADPATLREGTPYLDRVNRRRYYVLDGAWRYSALT